MSAHTPGPWIIDIEDDKRWDICVDRGDDLWVVVSMTPLLGSDVLTDKDKADARLIAAAPDLLEALKACDEAMSYMSEYDIPITLPDMVKAAIAKAIG